MANVVEVAIKSTADVSGYKKAETATKDLGDANEKYVDKADVAEQRTLGLKDAIDGTAVVMQGPGKAGILAYLQGWADIASGFANFIIPSLMKLTKATITNGIAQVKTAATTVAAWLAARAASVAAAIQMAAAWLISLGPIAIVIGVLAAVGLAFVALWKKSETFRDIVKGVFNVVKTAISPIIWYWQHLISYAEALVKMAGRVVSALKSIGGAFGWLGREITGAVKALLGWLTAAGALGTTGLSVLQTVKSYGPGGASSGGGGVAPGSKKGPGYAHGGMVAGGPTWMNERGGEAVGLPSGAHVMPSGAGWGGGGGGEIRVVFDFRDGGSELERALGNFVRRSIRIVGGGDPQRYLGFRTS